MQNQWADDGARKPPGRAPQEGEPGTTCPVSKYVFREEIGLGVLIASGHFQSLHLVAFTQGGTRCGI